MATLKACQRAIGSPGLQLCRSSLKRNRCKSTTTVTRIPPPPRAVTVSSTKNSNLNEFRRLMDLANTKEHRPLSSAASTLASTTDSDSSSNNDWLADMPGSIDPQWLQDLASRRPTPLKLADMYKYGTSTDMEQRLRNAQFLYDELQIRIAQRAVDLLTLPHGLSEAKPIRKVAGIYLEYLTKFQNMPKPTTPEEEEAFTDMLQGLVLDRTSVPMDISRGVAAWQRTIAASGETGVVESRWQEMEEALYRFFTSRVGLRFLIEHHVLSSPRPVAQELRKVTHVFPDECASNESGKVQLGCIHNNVDLVNEISRVADLVKQQTLEYYDVCPEIKILDCIPPGVSRDFTYVPHHLHYMLGELLKNSCRATVRHWNGVTDDGKKDKKEDMPCIRVIIVKGEEDVTVKIADKGGGIPRSLMETIWKFAHSTADEDEGRSEFGKDEFSGSRSIRGFGLPLCRIYARYFGGELRLKSTEGYGVDAYLHLPRLGTSGESLPLRVRASPGERDSTAKHVRH